MTVTEQREVARSYGNTRRLAKAADREHIRRGRLKVSDVILDPAEHWDNTLLFDLLLMAPFFGRHKLRAFNQAAMDAGVNAAVTLGELGLLDRALVAEYLREVGL